ncbi:MAG TPA: ABC transporter permease [Candidatus Binatia bacterium]|nr:ABC transporter permease [Candidatus Binatia bacterium]
MAGDLTTLAVNSSSAFGSRRNSQRQFPIIIRRNSGWVPINLKEIWEYRELFYFLAWRDIKVRYKQMFLGIGWALLQPFMTMLVFSFFLGRLVRVPSDGIPYPLFIFCALLPWQLFARALTDSSNSLVANQNLLTKVYFPRLIVPLAAGLPALVDFAFALAALVAMMSYYDLFLTPAVWKLPGLVLLALGAALGIGIWLAALNVKYRDAKHIVPFFLQIWLFVTPVSYPISLVPERWRLLYSLNPMTSVVEGFRSILIGTSTELTLMLAVSIAVVSLSMVSGLYYFQRMERTFADIV